MQNIRPITKNSFLYDAQKTTAEQSSWQPKYGNNLHGSISSASILEKLKDQPTQINAVSCSSSERDQRGNDQAHLRPMSSIQKQKKMNISSPSSNISFNSDDSIVNDNNNNISSQQSPEKGETLKIHEDYSGQMRQQTIRVNRTESMDNHSKSTSEGGTERTSNYSIARLELINQEKQITKQAQTNEESNHITKQRIYGISLGTKPREKNELYSQTSEKENIRELILDDSQKKQMLSNTAQKSIKIMEKINGKGINDVESELKENRELLNEQKQWINHWKMKAAGLEQKDKENKVRLKEMEDTLKFTERQLGEAQQRIKYQDERIKDTENKSKNLILQLEDIKIQVEEAEIKAQAADRQATQAIQIANEKEIFSKEAIKNAKQQEELMQIALQKLDKAENKVQEIDIQMKQAIEKTEQAETKLNEALNRVKTVEAMREEFRQKVIEAQNQVEEYNNLIIQYQNKIIHLESQIKQLQEDNILARKQSENYYLDLQDTRQSWKQRESEMNQGQLVLKEQHRYIKEVLEQTVRELRLLRVDYDEMKEDLMKKLSESESKLATNSLELERVTNKNKEYLRNIDSLTNNQLTLTKTHQFKIQHIEDQHQAMIEIAIEREGKAKRQEYETKIFYLDSQLKLLTKELTFWREKYASGEQVQPSY